VEESAAPAENATRYTVHKQTYSDGRAYSYHISDEADRLRYVAERAGMLLPSPTRLVEFFDAEHNPSGRLQPPEVAPWLRGTRYELFTGGDTEEAQEPYTVIQEQWELVDILLLHLPRYEVQFGQHRYVARGSRYGTHFYEIFLPCEEEIGAEDIGELEDKLESTEAEENDEEEGPQEVAIGRIQRPAAGPNYVIETYAAPLRQAPLVLAALVILIDIEIHS